MIRSDSHRHRVVRGHPHDPGTTVPKKSGTARGKVPRSAGRIRTPPGGPRTQHSIELAEAGQSLGCCAAPKLVVTASKELSSKGQIHGGLAEIVSGVTPPLPHGIPLQTTATVRSGAHKFDG